MRIIDADALLSSYDVRKVVEYDESGCGIAYNAVPVEAIKAAPTIEVERLRTGEFELFALITSVFYGKQTYFMQDDGTVYSRFDCDYMTFDQAVDEFCRTLSRELD